LSEQIAFGDLTFVLLLIAVGIFGALAVQSKSVKSFQFQISMILIVWIGGELVGIFGDMGYMQFENFEMLPPVIHMTAMIMISLIFWLRFYFAKKSGKKLVDEVYD